MAEAAVAAEEDLALALAILLPPLRVFVANSENENAAEAAALLSEICGDSSEWLPLFPPPLPPAIAAGDLALAGAEACNQTNRAERLKDEEDDDGSRFEYDEAALTRSIARSAAAI
mmetsp:Transcript_3316/g.8330  ORF Transcript_3316/g.8330 Transcript_3316/m.8330 type:complete len:116 (+) Transcript_3316:709-1056(+)